MKTRIAHTTLIISVLLLSGCPQAKRRADGTLPADDQKNDVARLLKLDKTYQRGEFEKAVEQSKAYVKDYPESTKGWSQLGWSYIKTEQLDLAQESFDKALKLDPEWDNAYVGQGVLHRINGDLGKARKAYLKAIELVPDNAEAFASLLVIELMEGDDEKAKEYGEKAWKLRKDNPSIPANLAIVYHYLGDIKKRDEFYQHAVRLKYHSLEGVRDIFEGRTSIR